MMSLTHNDFFKRIARWRSTEMKLAGGLEVIIAVTFLLPALYALLIGEDFSYFIYPAIPLMIIGTIQFLLFAPSENLRTVNGLIMVALVWILMFFLGSIPYFLAGMSPINAVFESVNGFTTTGSSTVYSVGEWPESILLWRSITQWLGGIAIVIIFIYLLPIFGMGRTFFNNELEGSGSSQFSMRLQNAARNFILVYVILSLINFVLLIICQAPLIDAICLSLTTISTGGLLISDISLMDASTPVQIVTMVFMFIGGVNFYLHFKAIYGKKPREYLRNNELKILILYFLIASFIVFSLIFIPKLGSLGYDLNEMLVDYKNSLFTVISLGTTTGASVYDFTECSELLLFIFLVLMMIGASAGSTSGGIKFTRIRIVVKFFYNTLKNVLHPNAVYSIKVDNESVEDSRVMAAVSVTLLYILTAFIGMIVVMTQGYSWTDSIGLSVGSLTNTGVGFGNFGPLGTYEVLPDEIKIFLMLLMWIGRLEITLALVFFTPGFWSDLRMAYRSSRNGRRIR